MNRKVIRNKCFIWLKKKKKKKKSIRFFVPPSGIWRRFRLMAEIFRTDILLLSSLLAEVRIRRWRQLALSLFQNPTDATLRSADYMNVCLNLGSNKITFHCFHDRRSKQDIIWQSTRFTITTLFITLPTNEGNQRLRFLFQKTKTIELPRY